jgi:hypothetical protein
MKLLDYIDTDMAAMLLTNIQSYVICAQRNVVCTFSCAHLIIYIIDNNNIDFRIFDSDFQMAKHRVSGLCEMFILASQLA